MFQKEPGYLGILRESGPVQGVGRMRDTGLSSQGNWGCLGQSTLLGSSLRRGRVSIYTGALPL